MRKSWWTYLKALDWPTVLVVGFIVITSAVISGELLARYLFE